MHLFCYWSFLSDERPDYVMQFGLLHLRLWLHNQEHLSYSSKRLVFHQVFLVEESFSNTRWTLSKCQAQVERPRYFSTIAVLFKRGPSSWQRSHLLTWVLHVRIDEGHYEKRKASADKTVIIPSWIVNSCRIHARRIGPTFLHKHVKDRVCQQRSL